MITKYFDPPRLAFVLLALCSISATYADTFGTDPNTAFEIEFVTIGNPGNAADTTGSPNPAGSVPYKYRIGKYEISEEMIDKANALGNLNIFYIPRGPNKPVTHLSWVEAAKFVNWLNTSSGNAPAYKFDYFGDFQVWDPNDEGYDPANLFRNSQAYYFLPSSDEWYKAAYFHPDSSVYYDYPTGSDDRPTPVASGTAAGTAVFLQSVATDIADITLAGGLSPYGTMGQGGNVFEMQESSFDLLNGVAHSPRIVRGGGWVSSDRDMAAWNRRSQDPRSGNGLFGFRVASRIPEPATSALALAVLCLAMGNGRNPQVVARRPHV